MSNWIRRAAVAAVLGGAVMGSGITAMATEPGPAPSELVTLEMRLKIVEVKLKVADTKAKAAGLTGPGSTDAQKAAAQSILAELDQIYSILEDMLQNG